VRAAAEATTVLAADIGGTNARYQLWRVPSGGGAPALSFEKARPARGTRCAVTWQRSAQRNG